jgi:two-component system sensor histidine kinase QseC
MVLCIAAALLVWVATNIFVYTRALDEVDALYDLHLAQSAHLMLAVVGNSANRGNLDRLELRLPLQVPAYESSTHMLTGYASVDGTNHQHELAYQVVDRHGSLLLRSPMAPAEPLGQAGAGFCESDIDGTRWRVYRVADPTHGLVLYAAEDHAVRERLAAHMVDHLLLPSLLAVPPLLLLFWLAVGRGLKPLQRLVLDIKGRDPRDLQPLGQTLRPPELTPLVDALNALLNRLDRALESERSFTGSAAHELRTPLSALRVQAQVAMRATHGAQRQRALEQVIAAVDQAAHLVEQLLTLARLEGQNGINTSERVSLLDAARRCAAELETTARSRSILLEVSGADEIVAHGNQDAIHILLRNLIDNAIRYTPNDGKVMITVGHWGLYNRVIIDDTGPGIDDAQVADMFKRFRRGADVTRPGSGLGLAIARQICELHGGGMHLENRQGGGLRCEVVLPVAITTPSDATDAITDAAARPSILKRFRRPSAPGSTP